MHPDYFTMPQQRDNAPTTICFKFSVVRVSLWWVSLVVVLGFFGRWLAACWWLALLFSPLHCSVLLFSPLLSSSLPSSLTSSSLLPCPLLSGLVDWFVSLVSLAGGLLVACAALLSSSLLFSSLISLFFLFSSLLFCPVLCGWFLWFLS